MTWQPGLGLSGVTGERPPREPTFDEVLRGWTLEHPAESSLSTEDEAEQNVWSAEDLLAWEPLPVEELGLGRAFTLAEVRRIRRRAVLTGALIVITLVIGVGVLWSAASVLRGDGLPGWTTLDTYISVFRL